MQVASGSKCKYLPEGKKYDNEIFVHSRRFYDSVIGSLQGEEDACIYVGANEKVQRTLIKARNPPIPNNFAHP